MNQDAFNNVLTSLESNIANLLARFELQQEELNRLEKENSDLLHVVVQQQQLIENLQQSALMMQNSNPEEIFDRERLEQQLSAFLVEINQCLSIINVLETERELNDKD